MRFLEKLLDGAEAAWVPLGEAIISLKTGLNPRKNFQLNASDAEGYYVTVREIQNGGIVFSDKTDRVNSEALKLINNRSDLKAGDILFSGTGTVGRIAVIEKTPENWNIKEGVYAIKPIHEKIFAKYLAHLLNSQNIVQEYSRKIVGSPVISLPMKELKKLPIPIPCPDNPAKSLAIQAEIVRILDAFTAMTTELTTELSARKKQYNYYRERLLGFTGLFTEPPHPLCVHPTTPSGFACHPSKGGEWDGNRREAGEKLPFLEKLLDGAEVTWQALGEVGKFIRGSGIQKSDFTESGVGCIHYGQIHTHYGTWATATKTFIAPDFAARLRKAQTGDLVIATTSENDEAVAKAVAWLGHEDVAISTDAYIFRHALNPKYMSYFFQTEFFQTQKKPKITGTKVRRVSGESLAKIRIPIPCPDNPAKSLAIQAEIVRILDTFDTLTHSISEGLPREIALRRKQYDYYRDLLFSFPKPEEGGRLK